NQLTIFDTTNEIDPIYKTIDMVFNQIPYYSPTGMFVDDKYLVVVLNVYDMNIQNDNFTESDQNTETHVYVFDKHDDFKLDNNYVIDGAIKEVSKNNQRLMLITEHAIPFSKEELNVDNYLPTYFINGIANKSSYNDIRYIQGTNPKVFLTTSTINLETNHIDQEILLTDNQHHIYMTQNAVYFSILSHDFVETSETFVLSEPVEKTYTSLTQINFERDVVRYHTTNMLEGKIADANSIHAYDNQLCIGTIEKSNDIYINRVYILDDSLQVLAKTSINNENNSMMDSIRFINHHAYIAYQDSSLPFTVIDLDNLDKDSVETIEFSSYLHKINNNYALGIGYDDNGNNGIVDSVNISLYNISNLDSIYIVDSETILFSDYGLTVSDALMNKTMIYNSNQRVLIYPINMFTRINNSTQQGVLLFDIDFTDGIEYKAFLTHENEIVSFNNYRSVFHGEYLYTISNDYVSVSHVDDIDNIIHIYELN
ncbi:MAG: beta-propeller domain-containing protein, partial [Bacillota bacterium]